MNNHKQFLFEKNYFDKEYFEEGKGLKLKQIYDWESKWLDLSVIANSINNAIKPKIVLDIGCAKGYLVYLLEELGIDAYGVDVSSYAVSCAPKKIADRFYVLDIQKSKLPFPDDYFDLITVIEVLEHLNSFEYLLKEIKRIIKKGGYIFVATPRPKTRYAKIDKSHINVQPKKFWVELFNRFGLALVKDKVWHSFKISFLGEFKKVMPKNPPSTKISMLLLKMGKIGNSIRNNIIPYIDHFSILRAHEIMLFRKT